MMDYSRMVQDQEDANIAACVAVFMKAHPGEPPEFAEDCDAGSWNCPNCPWAKTTAFLHSSNLTIMDSK